MSNQKPFKPVRPAAGGEVGLARHCRGSAGAAQPLELSIEEHTAAIALVNDMRPYCSRWMVELQRPEIAREIGIIVVAEGAVPAWAIYRDADAILHFEDLTGGHSHIFSSMDAGLRMVRGALEAAAVATEERHARQKWWDRLPAWLIEDPLKD